MSRCWGARTVWPPRGCSCGESSSTTSGISPTWPDQPCGAWRCWRRRKLSSASAHSMSGTYLCAGSRKVANTGWGRSLVTQQPGSIANQIISQGDNFFVLHLLNENDLQTLKRHNAYYSDEILSFIRSEPIPGNCYFWSAPNQPFVLPVRVCNFETVCRMSTRTDEFGAAH